MLSVKPMSRKSSAVKPEPAKHAVPPPWQSVPMSISMPAKRWWATVYFAIIDVSTMHMMLLIGELDEATVFKFQLKLVHFSLGAHNAFTW